jgi:hypothetical protein
MNKYILTIYSSLTSEIFCFKSFKDKVKDICKELNELNKEALARDSISFKFHGHSFLSNPNFRFEIEPLEEFFNNRLAEF